MKYANKIAAILFICFLIFWVLRAIYKRQELKHSFKLTTGRIDKITNPTYKNNNRTVQYEYEVDGKKYAGENSLTSCEGITGDSLRLLLVNHFFPIAYSTKDVSSSFIIITSADAQKFNYTIPDSMLVYDSVLTCK